MNWIANLLFGRRRYRVKYTYTVNYSEIFSFYRTLGVYETILIGNRREMNISLGDLREVLPKDKRNLLQNGVLQPEPVCYLGRWK